MDVDLILEAADLMDKKANDINYRVTSESQETSGKGPEKSEKEVGAVSLAIPVGGDSGLHVVQGEEEERERKRAVQDFTHSFPSSAAELPNEKHNENERKRRKMLKLSVHSLRDQLKNKTRRPAVNTVLRAAYEEIQELKKLEDEQSKVLEELKQKNIILNCYLEKQLRDIKLGKRSGPSPEESDGTHSLPSTRSDPPSSSSLLTHSVLNNGGSIRIPDTSNSDTSPPPLQSIVPASNPTPPSLQWFSPTTLPFHSPSTLLPTLHTPSLFTPSLMQQPTPTQPNILLQQSAPPTQAPVLFQQTTPHTQPSLLSPFLSYVYPNPSPILYRPTIFIPNPSPISPPSLMPVPICQPLAEGTVAPSLFSSSGGHEDDHDVKVTTSKIPPLISINALKLSENAKFGGGQRKQSISPNGKEIRINGENGRSGSGPGMESLRSLANGHHYNRSS